MYFHLIGFYIQNRKIRVLSLLFIIQYIIYAPGVFDEYVIVCSRINESIIQHLYINTSHIIINTYSCHVIRHKYEYGYTYLFSYLNKHGQVEVKNIIQYKQYIFTFISINVIMNNAQYTILAMYIFTKRVI